MRGRFAYSLGWMTVAFLFAGSTGASAYSPEKESKLLDFEDVVQLLKSHPEVSSAEGLLEVLPRDFRNRFVLMHTSESLHRHCVSPENPRIIFYNEDASLILAAANPNGAEGCRSHMVEAIQFREKEARFEFHSIEFGGPGKRPVVSAPNPAACLRCHSPDPHPLWGSYFVWPGAYGSLDDTILESQYIRPRDAHRPLPLETIGYETFMASKRHHGIFRSLVWENGRDTLNVGRPRYGTPKPKDWSSYNAFYRPNFILQEELKEKNEKRIRRLLESDPDYLSFWDAIFYAQRCEHDYGGLRDLIQALPEGPRRAFAAFPVPKKIPEKVKDTYSDHALEGKWGHANEIEPFNPFVARQVEAYEKAIQKLELGIPRFWWGYLGTKETGNPSNTELPRIPFAGDWDILMYYAEIATPIEYFLNVRGRSLQTWFLPREGYIGTEGEAHGLEFVNNSSPSGGYPNCKEAKQNAVKAITAWWEKQKSSVQ